MADSSEKPKSPPRRQHAFQAPKGTRDFYPDDLLKRRWIEETWRQVALRHGFDEIDGPRFEHTDLYTVKSGEGILSELFSFKRWAPGEGPLRGGAARAGSSPSRSETGNIASSCNVDRAGDGPARADTGKWYALRPEFTPTLARMVAARANSLPKPIKWFSVGPYFRAERPQRGRLREFLQWNVDVLGSTDDDELTKAQQDAEVIACCVEMLRSAGLGPDQVRIKISDRRFLSETLSLFDIPEDRHEEAFAHLDKWDKMEPDERRKGAEKLGVPEYLLDDFTKFMTLDAEAGKPNKRYTGSDRDVDPKTFFMNELGLLNKLLHERGIAEWCNYTPSIVRGLAYYTGMVFEVHEVGGKERAIAGGGRYDKLVELFGGPPTPACGFAMGDVVLSLVLQDKGLMPSDAELAETLGARPDVFVISTGKDESEEAVLPLVAELRRSGLHTRHTYRSTRNIGKLLKEAAACHARFAVIIDDANSATLKNLDTQEQQEEVALDKLACAIQSSSC